jgi:hypothetical protein
LVEAKVASLNPSKVNSLAENLASAQIRDLQTQIHQIGMQIVGNGVQIGMKVFQTFNDVCTWVVTGIPDRCYGLFMDGVLLLDFFSCIGHVDAEKTF